MSAVLVLGSNSFSGASFVRYLLLQGLDVIGASRSSEAAEVFLPNKWLTAEQQARFRFVQLDLNHDLDKLEQLTRDEHIQVIANFAAQSMVGESWDKPDDWMQTNVVSVARLAERLRHIDFLEKYVHVTTPEVYGSTDGWITEDTPFNPSTPYAVSRAAGDMLFKIYRETLRAAGCLYPRCQCLWPRATALPNYSQNHLFSAHRPHARVAWWWRVNKIVHSH